MVYSVPYKADILQKQTYCLCMVYFYHFILSRSSNVQSA